MKRFFVVLVFLALVSFSYALSLLDGTIGARPLSLGASYVAVGGDNESIFWNPAGLPNVKYASFSLGYQNRFLGFNYIDFYTSFKLPMKTIDLLNGVWGVGFAYWGTEEERWNEFNELAGNVSANEYIVGVGYKKVFSDALSFGATLKFAGQTVDDASSLTFLLDVGALSKIEGVGIGIAIKNIGFGSETINIPMGISLGAYYTVFATPDNQHNVAISGELDSVQGSGFSLKGGAEYTWMPVFWDGIIRVRLGYDTLPSKDLGILSGLGFGFDVSWYGATLKYSLYNMGFAGASHTVQLSYDLDFVLGKTLAEKDTEKPTLALIVRPKFIIPSVKGYESVNIDINIADNVGVKVWGYTISDSSDNVVYSYSLTNAKPLPKVSKSVAWEGKTEGGNMLYDDTYTLKVFAYDEAGNLSEKVEKNIVISTDPRNIILVTDKEVITSPRDEVNIRSLRGAIDNIISYRIVVVSQSTGNVVKEFKEVAKVQTTKGGKVASGQVLKFDSIKWDLKDNNGEIVPNGVYIIQGEFEFVGNVQKKSFSAEIKVEM